MTRTRWLISNLTLLNVLIAVLLLCAVIYGAWPFFGPGIDVAPAAVAESAAEPASAPAVASTAVPGLSPVDFAVVAEQNLFHPERRLPQGKDQALPRPDVVLYGTLITGETRIAYVEDRKSPQSSPGRGKRQVALKKGGQLSGYVLQEVYAERIVLLKGDDRIAVGLNDDRNKRQAAGAAAPAAPAPPAAAPAAQTPKAPAAPPAVSIVPGTQQSETSAHTPINSKATVINQPSVPQTPLRRTRHPYSR